VPGPAILPALSAEVHAVVEAWFIPIQLILAMLGMGATLSVRDFAGVVRYPGGLFLGLVLQLVVVPAIALGIAELFDLSAGWAVGLLLVSVVPGGAFSNLLTFLGRGNTPLSISLTVAATASCIVTVPLILQVTASAHLPEDFSFPTGRIVGEIFAYLLIPLAAGMVLFRLHEPVSRRVSKWAIRGSLLCIVLITISALGSGRIDVPAYGWKPPLVIILFGVTLMIIIPLACRLAGRYDDDTVAIGVEVTVRNVGVGLLLIHFFFPGQEAQGHVLYTCLFYPGLAMWLSLPQALLHRAGRSPIVFLRPHRRPEAAPPE
jgi:bile acid:Na+ symporter, BASS family